MDQLPPYLPLERRRHWGFWPERYGLERSAADMRVQPFHFSRSGFDPAGAEQIIILRYARQPTDRSIAVAHHHSRCVLISTSLGMYTSSTKPGKAISFRAYFFGFWLYRGRPQARREFRTLHSRNSSVRVQSSPPYSDPNTKPVEGEPDHDQVSDQLDDCSRDVMLRWFRARQFRL